MMEQIRNSYFNSRTQIIVLNKNGQVLQTDNQLYDFPLESLLEDFHPFFCILPSLLGDDDQETVFSGVHMDYKGTEMVFDVIVNSGSETTNPFVVLIDFSSYYKNFQSIAQEKNESILSFHLEELKNKQLESEKVFKDKFLANVSHDLKTPLWGTTFFANKLEQTELTPTQMDYVKTIKESNEHMYHLVQDLLDLSKIESGQMELVNDVFDVHQSIAHLESIFKPKAFEKKLQLKVEMDASIPKLIIGDKIRLNQILINLLDNSIKFTQEGSVALIINLNKNIEGQLQLLFIVSDTGSGIETTNKADVFLSFKKLHSSKKIEGLGLGLAIVSNLVKLMNGQIDFQTETNKGTTFEVVLPFGV
jgi:signal transduction histidine kinase